MPTKKNTPGEERAGGAARESTVATWTPQSKVKFEVYGEEILEKSVKFSGNSGRVYLPPEWVGRRVKIIRID